MTGATARLPPLALLIAAATMGPLGLHILIPVLPTLSAQFGVDYGAAQLTVSAYMLGLAGAQLFYGPLSDRFGRRPLVISGLLLAAIATVICALATSIEMLLVGRLLQAVGGCAGVVLGRAIIRDVAERDRGASLIALVTMAAAIAPGAAPIIGNAIDAALGWRAIFALLGTAAVLILLVAWRHLPETNRQRLSYLDFPGTVRNYGTLLRNPIFIGNALVAAVMTGGYYGFLGGAPYVLVTVMGRPVEEYGLYFILLVLAYILGSFLANRISQKLGGDRMIALGLGISAVAIVTMCILAEFLPPHPLALFLPMSVNIVGNGISQPNAMSAAIGARPELAGSASGLVGFLQFSISAVLSWIVSHALSNSALSMLLVMLGAVMVAVLAALVARHAAARSA